MTTIVVATLLGGGLTALVLPRDGAEPVLTAGRAQDAALPHDITAPAAAQPQVSGPVPAEQGEQAAPTASPSVPAPRRLSIPRLSLEMPVTPRGVDPAGAMALPRSASTAGWYRFGAHPLGVEGATVLAGHVDTVEEGPGPLARIGELRRGDRIEVRTGRRTTGYVVTSVTRIAKSVLDLPAVFSRVGRPRLHLLTCGGAYLPDRGGYQDNVLVAARRVAR